MSAELLGLADRLAHWIACGAEPGESEDMDAIRVWEAELRALAARLPDASLHGFPVVVNPALPPDGWVLVPREPTEAQWGGLARDVVMWMQAYSRHDSDSLLKHLDRSGTEIPEWLRKEADTGPHSLPKGSIAAIIYKAMIAAPTGGQHGK